MRSGSTGSHLSRNPDRFHDLLLRCAFQRCPLRVGSNAIRTLRYVSHRDGDQVLCLPIQRTVLKNALTKRLKCCEDIRCEIFPLLRKLS